jgi:uncharacterized protein involved in type VI secretion and phage assembly
MGGLYPATVTALASDPQSRQRVEVELPWLDGAPRLWATVITPYADADQGFQMLPEIGSTVVVGFEHGNLRHPYLVGAVWNGKAQAPEAFTDRNDKRLIRTRSGCLLEFDDTPGAVKITVRTPGGHELVLDDGRVRIELRASSGARIELTPAGGVTIEAASTVDVTAAMVKVDAPMSTFSGVVKCDTLIATTGVVSPSYTPGAGNIW